MVSKGEKTMYPQHTADLIAKIDQMKPWLNKIIGATEEYIDINIGACTWFVIASCEGIWIMPKFCLLLILTLIHVTISIPLWIIICKKLKENLFPSSYQGRGCFPEEQGEDNHKW